MALDSFNSSLWIEKKMEMARKLRAAYLRQMFVRLAACIMRRRSVQRVRLENGSSQCPPRSDSAGEVRATRSLLRGNATRDGLRAIAQPPCGRPRRGPPRASQRSPFDDRGDQVAARR
jgi:hypothetical protein